MRDPEFTGVTERDGIQYCSGCGAEITDGAIHFVSHADGEDFYINTFACNACMNEISAKFFREDEEDE